MHELISIKKKKEKKGQVGNKLLNILSKSSHPRKKPPPPHKGFMGTVGESAQKVDSGRIFPCHTGELNLPQWHAGLTLY